MKILLTGAAGFIGSHVARVLCTQEHEVVGLDNFNDYYSIDQKEWNASRLAEDFPENFTLIRGDVTDSPLLENLFREHKFEKVCHLSARAGVRPSLENPRLYQEVNIGGTLNILEACRIYDVPKLVYASSSSVYGACTELPFSETLNLKPISPYAATKLANENDAHVYSHLHGISTVGLRFFTVYGPSGRPDMAPHLFTHWIENGMPISKFGDGTTSRDYTYIDDIVSGVLAALEHETQYDIFNLGNSQTVSLNEFIETVEKVTGKKAIIQQKPMQLGDIPNTFADISHAKEKLGYNPKTNIEEGMKKVVEWYREYHHTS